MARNPAVKQIYLLAAVMIAVVALVIWRYVSPNRNVERAAQQITEIAGQIRQRYTNRVDYWGLDTQTAIDNNILTNLSYDGRNLNNALGKPVLIGSGENADSVMPGERSFDIVYSRLSLGECVALASYRFEHPEESGLLQITIVSDGKSQSFGWGEEINKLPISRLKAKEFCRKNSKVLWTME